MAQPVRNATLSKATLDDGNKLCVSCALCCDGSIFHNARVDSQERERMGDLVNYLPARKSDDDDTHRIAFPCPQLGKDGACQCYTVRPSICHTYQCKLLRAVKSESVSLTDAQQTVKTAQALRNHSRTLCNEAAAQVPEANEEGRLERAMRLLQRAKETNDERVDVALLARAKLHFDHYARFIREHFYSKYTRTGDHRGQPSSSQQP
ncbi:MAG: Fe-S-cluster containining protein [Neolewinella sp.]|jgi:Fe-S-cluster containining protein